MYKTFFDIIVDPENNIGVTFFAIEPDEPFESTSAFLRIYKDNPGNTIVEKRFYAVDELACWKLHLLPSEDFLTCLLGLRITFSINNLGTVFAVIDSTTFKATFKFKNVKGTTELPF